MTLVAAYERLIGARGTEIKDGDPAPAIVGVPPVIMNPSDQPSVARLHIVQTHASASATASRRRQKRSPTRSANTPENGASATTASDILPIVRAHAFHYNAGMARIFLPIAAESFSRRSFLLSAAAFAASFCIDGAAVAVQSPAFAHWVANFRPRALARGISEQTYDRVMGAVKPDTSVYAQIQRAARIHRTDVAIHQPPLLRLARHHRQRAREGICRAALRASKRTTASTATSCSGCGAWSRRSAT